MSEDKLKNSITVTGDVAIDITAFLIIDRFLNTDASSTALARKIQEHFPGALDGTWRAWTKGIGTVVMGTDRPLISARGVKGAHFLPKEPFTVPQPPEPSVTAEDPTPSTVAEKPKSRARHMWDIVKTTLL